MPRKKTRKRYSQEVREEAVNLVTKEGHTAVRAGKKLRVNPNTLRDWVRAEKAKKEKKETDHHIPRGGFYKARVYKKKDGSSLNFPAYGSDSTSVVEVAPEVVATISARPEEGHAIIVNLPINTFQLRAVIRTGRDVEVAHRVKWRPPVYYSPDKAQALVVKPEHFPDHFQDGKSVLEISVLRKPEAPSPLVTSFTEARVESAVREALTKVMPTVVREAITALA